MIYLYLKALHIIFVVAWFAGLFYMPRLLIYTAEANQKAEPARSILQNHFKLMMRRLWYIITIPASALTLVLGLVLMFKGNWYVVLFMSSGLWLLLKLIFVIGLFFYQYSLHKIFIQQCNNIFKYSPQQLRIWNEVATIFLVAIVFLAVLKQAISLLWGLFGIIGLMLVLLLAIYVYKHLRTRKK